MEKGWVLEIGFLFLALENSINEALLKGWLSNHKSSHCQGELHFPELLRLVFL